MITKFDFKKHFQKTGVTQAHARRIIGFYEGELEEFREILKIPTAGQLSKMDEKDADLWEQLKEGYSHLSKKEVQKYISALETLVEACNYVIDTSKATRKPRKTKPRSADKVVEKLKFAKKDALIMHPGPMNRGVEIDTNLADDINKSLIKEQVELGVAVRMSCLKLFCCKKK